ncbi:MAG: TetR/AcrR family transcriptional regulator [Clostridiales bacterium]|nr:TetR/AcrR family transcriptional regulator [Clostridiales bacterium]
MNQTINPIAIRSKQELIQALLDLMKTAPYCEITVKQILLESKLSKKTFYRNFNNKDDLLDAYLDILLSKYIDGLTKRNDFRFPQILEIISNFVITNKETLLLFWNSHLEYLILKKLNLYILSHHYNITKNEHSRIEDYIIRLNIGAIWNVLNEWMRSGATDSIDNILSGIKSYMENIKNIDLKDIPI